VLLVSIAGAHTTDVVEAVLPLLRLYF